MDCPYYERVQRPIARGFVRGYCLGCLTAGIMVPSLVEERTYCLMDDGGYLKCPTYHSNLKAIVVKETGCVGVAKTEEAS